VGFEAKNSTEAFEFYSRESARAELIREAMSGNADEISQEKPTPLLPASWNRQIPVPENVLNDVLDTIRDYETAMKTLLGHYATAMNREQAEGPRQQLQAAGGWQR